MNNLQPGSMVWRWIALVAVLINIFFNYYLNAYPIGGQTIGDVSDKYPTLITPAGYAFSIWGVIYLSFIIYVIAQVLPSQRMNQVYNRLAKLLIATSVLSIGWLISFSMEYISVSVLIITGMLLTAILLFGRSKMATFQHQASFWITIPFGLYVAWLSVATVVNISVWLTDIGWHASITSSTLWTIVMIGAILALAVIISYKFRDLSYLLVASWATFAIYVAQKNKNEAVATAALCTGILLALWTAGYGVWLYKSSGKTMSGGHNYEAGNSAWSYKNR